MNYSMSFSDEKYDAILLAGEGESSYKVYHQHKAFLKINDKYIISYVVEALQQVESIKDIYIVGSKNKLKQTLRESGIDFSYPKTIHLIEQETNLYENIFQTFLKTISREKNLPTIDLEVSQNKDKAVLIVPCDSPLLTPHEVEYFISHSDTNNYDHVLGLIPEDLLKQFYPTGSLPGIKMAYLHLKENNYRINNLHLVKPLRIANRKYIQQMYQYRYQRDFKKIMLFGRNLLGKIKLKHYRCYIGLQLCQFFSSIGWNLPVKYFKKWTEKKDMENCISNLLNTRFKGLEVPYPGAALDIDRDSDYEAMKIRYNEWHNTLQSIKNFPTSTNNKSHVTG
ncbi:MAG: NTP transferase domain-containing protein [Nitrospina sp.]|nr:NTP transferase domain-containing protein [Nitrospina sp.]